MLISLLWVNVVQSQEGALQKNEMKMPALPKLGDKLTDSQVTAFAKLALDGISVEYPNKPSNVMVGPQSVVSPRQMHPAFYGCFDWHSSVHGHWMLVRLLHEFPNCSLAPQMRERLEISLTAENMKKEAEYFVLDHNKNFERMYGWAWLLRLVVELELWNDPSAKAWRENLRPLENILVQKMTDYLPKLSYPIRTGEHPDTGFALSQALDYARQVENVELEKLIVDRCRYYYLADTDYPTKYEPSGQDFFSSCLNEADLMRRVLGSDEYVAWFDKFLPTLLRGEGGNLLIPVEVSDVTDGKIVHLAGLDLSRGWCLQGIASSLPKGDPRIELLNKSAAEHTEMGYKYVFSGHYEGEHWLATFAIYLHTKVGVRD